MEILSKLAGFVIGLVLNLSLIAACGFIISGAIVLIGPTLLSFCNFVFDFCQYLLIDIKLWIALVAGIVIILLFGRFIDKEE